MPSGILGMTALVLLPLAEARAPREPLSMFEPVDLRCQARILGRQRVPALRSRVGRLSPRIAADLLARSAEPSSRLPVLVNLFSDASFRVELRPGRQAREERATWVEARSPSGLVPRVVITVTRDRRDGLRSPLPVLAGTVWTAAQGSYEIVPAGDDLPGLYVIREPDFRRLATCGADAVRVEVAKEQAMGRAARALDLGAMGTGGDGAQGQTPRTQRGCADVPDQSSTIDTLVVYTAAAACTAGGAATIEALIGQTIDGFQRALDDGQTNVVVQLAGMRQIDWDEAGTDMERLCRLVSPDDGVLDEIHAWRNEVQADVVVLVLCTLSSNGLAPRLMSCSDAKMKLPGCRRGKPLSNADLAFALVDLDAMLANLTLAHEVGHILGCCHDPSIPCDSPLFDHGHGHRLVPDGSKGGTIVALPTGMPRVPFFSDADPQATCDVGGTAYALGVPDVSNNVDVIRRTAPLVAAYR